MDDIAIYTILQLSSLAALYVELEELENGNELQSSRAPRLRRIYRPPVDNQQHRFHLEELSNVKVREFRRYVASRQV
jgi:hypothetical protein